MFRVDYMPGHNSRLDINNLVRLEREEFNTLEEVREEVRRRLGDLDDWRKFPDDSHTVSHVGGANYNGVEGYYTSRDPADKVVVISRCELRPLPPKLRLAR